jgi:glycosyltransferase involved in cell wall biosynthesis
MTKQARVSIGIPVYNGENYLAEALDSLLRQSFRDFEILISDNASTDRTPEICRDYAARDSRIRCVRQPRNIGAGPNHNRVLELSQSLYFKWAAHDDLYAPTYLEECVKMLDRNPDVVLAHADGPLIDADGKPLSFDIFRQCYTDRGGKRYVREPVDIAQSDVPSERFGDVLHRIVWCTAMYGLIRRDATNRVTLMRSYYGSDKVFLAEMALLGKFHHVREPLFMKRCHAKMSAQMTAKQRVAFMDTASPKAFPYLELFKGYTRAALRTGSLDLSQRMLCVASVARKTIQARYWHTAEEV